MRLSTGYDVGVPDLHTNLVVLLTLFAGVNTVLIPGSYSKPPTHKRLDVTPRDVLTRSSAINCETTCRLTSWCFAANLLPDRRTCQLLTEEVSDDDESLDSADGWKYFRKFAANSFYKFYIRRKVAKISAFAFGAQKSPLLTSSVVLYLYASFIHNAV